METTIHSNAPTMLPHVTQRQRASLPARAIAIDAGEAHHDGPEKNRPSQDRKKPFRRRRQTDELQDQWQDDNPGDRKDDEKDSR